MQQRAQMNKSSVFDIKAMSILLFLVLLGLAASGCATGRPMVAPHSEAFPGILEETEFYLISFDRDGCEIPSDTGSYLSDRIVRRIPSAEGESVEVMIACHGWQYDFLRARGEFLKWIAKYLANKELLERFSQDAVDSHGIVIGLHWPSASHSNLSFWYMRGRARLVAERGGYMLLRKLQAAVKPGGNAKFHLMGHSLGAVVISEMLLGRPDLKSEIHPIDSLLLVEGAAPIWAFCSRIPEPWRPYKNLEEDIGPGYYWHIIRDGLVKGPIVNVYSKNDKVLRRWFTFANSDRGAQPKEFRDAPPYGEGPNPRTDEYPTFGAIGAYGIRGPLPCVVDIDMLQASEEYSLRGGCIYNVDGSKFIKNHMDFVNLQVWNLMHQTHLADQPSR